MRQKNSGLEKVSCACILRVPCTSRGECSAKFDRTCVSPTHIKIRFGSHATLLPYISTDEKNLLPAQLQRQQRVDEEARFKGHSRSFTRR